MVTDAIFSTQGAVAQAAFGPTAAGGLPTGSDFVDGLLAKGDVSTRPVPSLCDHIQRIGFGITEKQMLRVHASSNVATVEYPHAFWDRAIVYFPRKAWRVNQRPVNRKLASAAGLGASPQPTLIRGALVDLRPESLLNRLHGSYILSIVEEGNV